MMKKSIFLIVIIFFLITLQAQKKNSKSENLPLHNTQWVLHELFETRIYQYSDTAFIVFYDNYKFYGNFGCNVFFGEYSFTKKRIKLDYIGATKKICTDMRIEERFFKAIKSDITHYYIEENTLYLLHKLKVVCKFKGKIND